MFVETQQAEGRYTLHPTSIFELERFAKSSMDGAVAVCRRVMERHAANTELVKEMRRDIDNWNQVARMEFKDVGELKKIVGKNNRLYWFEYETETKIEFGLLVLSPDGNVVHRTLDSTINRAE